MSLDQPVTVAAPNPAPEPIADPTSPQVLAIMPDSAEALAADLAPSTSFVQPSVKDPAIDVSDENDETVVTSPLRRASA